MRRWFIVQYTELVAATRFLSILPLPGSSRLFETQSVGTDSARPTLVLGSAYFPLVGLLLALILSLLTLIFRYIFPPLVVSALLTVALVLLTGGLHLDGLMDSCDGVFGGRTRERRLEIMRDSRVGSFGVLGGVCVLLLKFAVITSLLQLNIYALCIAFLVTLPNSRWAMVCALRVFPSARAGGLGATFRQTVTPARLLVAGGSALLITASTGHLAGILLWLVTTSIAFIMGAWFMDRLGGLTGDSYGAIAEVSEVVALLFCLGLRV